MTNDKETIDLRVIIKKLFSKKKLFVKTLAWAFWAVTFVYGNGDDGQKTRVLQLRDKLKTIAKTNELRSILEQYNP